MARLLLTEDVFLLAHEEQSGRNTVGVGLPGALAGALLLDLAEHGLVVVGQEQVEATGATTTDPLLARAAAVVRDEPRPRKAGHWLSALPRALKPFEQTVGESLVARGVLTEEHGKTLGLFATTRWPERDPGPEQRLRAELREALLGTADPSTRVLLLAGLVKQYGLVDRLVDRTERKQARARAEEFAKLAESSDAVSQAVGDSVRAAQLAVMTAVNAATVVTTVAPGSS